MKKKLLKMEKDSCINVDGYLKLAMKKVGKVLVHFIIFVLKTTSMYFDLNY